MPKRIVVQTVVVHREGARVLPPIGQVFDFTAQELDYINKLNPSAVAKVEAPAKEFVVDGGEGGEGADTGEGGEGTDTGTETGADASASTALAPTGGRAGRPGRQTAAAADGDI